MKIFVDNNLPEKLAKILDILDDNTEVKHIKEMFPPDTKDIQWIQALSNDGKWLILTQDIHITKRRVELCALRESGLSIICLEKGWSNMTLHVKVSKLINNWPSIVSATSKAQKQTIWSISAKNCKIEDLTSKFI